jgi:hypothetical protein
MSNRQPTHELRSADSHVRAYPFYELFELPPGFGLRQPSGAMGVVPIAIKAVEGHRSPRRCRVEASFLQFMALKAPMNDFGIVEVCQTSTRTWLSALRQTRQNRIFQK